MFKKQLLLIIVSAFMCGNVFGASKITELTELTSGADGDLVAIVDDVSGTPTTKKIAVGNIFNDVTDVSFGGKIHFDTSYTPVSPEEGDEYWDTENNTKTTVLSKGVMVQNGQEMVFEFKNTSGGRIENGNVVYITGSSGTNIEVSLADKSSVDTSKGTIAMCTDESGVDNNQTTWFTILGVVNGLNTNLTGGDDTGQTVYLGDDGAFTLTEATYPDHYVKIGVIKRDHATEGSIFLDIKQGQHFEFLYEVLITDAADGDTLSYNSDGQLVNRTNLFNDGSTVQSGDISGGNYSEIEADGTVVYNGDATVWEDLNFAVVRSGGPVATRPDDVTINNVYYKEFTSSNNQTCGDEQEIPHSYKLGENLYPHLHGFLKAAESEGTTGVEFTIYYEVREDDGTVTNGSTTVSATSAEILAAQGELITMYNSGFAGSDVLGGQLALRLDRTGGDAGDFIVTTYGVHYEKDMTGSHAIDAK